MLHIAFVTLEARCAAVRKLPPMLYRCFAALQSEQCQCLYTMHTFNVLFLFVYFVVRVLVGRDPTGYLTCSVSFCFLGEVIEVCWV